MRNDFIEDDDIRIYIDSQRIKDAVTQLNVIKKSLKNRHVNTAIATYQDRNDSSGFRRVTLVDGTSVYTNYQSNANITQGKVVDGYYDKSVLGSPNLIDSKPASR